MGCISHLSTVDLEVAARDNEVVVFVFWRLEQFEDVAGGERVDSVLRVLRLAVELSTHRVGLAWWVGNNKLLRATRAIYLNNKINNKDRGNEKVNYDRLTRSSLSISKAGGHPALKDRLDQRPGKDFMLIEKK